MLDPAVRLRQAIISGNLSVTKRLLARFPELWLNIDPNKGGWCNLHYASFYGNYLVCFHLVSVMKQLRNLRFDLEPLCDIDLITFDSLTVLHMPLQHHHSQTLHFLLQEFPSSHWINYRGGPLLRTPLHYCCMYRFVDGLKLLLEFGADWTIQDANGDTCLHLGFAYGDIQFLEESTKYIIARQLQKITSQLEEQSDDSQGTIAKASLECPGEELRNLLNSEIEKFENITNNSKCQATAYAASFEMEYKYFSLKKHWVDLAIEEELASRLESQWDVSSSIYEFYPEKSYPRSGPPSSSLANYSYHASNSRTSFDTDIVDISSSASGEATAQHTFNYDNLISSPSQQAEIDALSNKGRKHSHSLPPSVEVDQAAQVSEKSQQARKHSRSFAYRSTPSSMRSSTVPGAPMSPLQVEFLSTQSRKSTIKIPSNKSLKQNDKDPRVDEGNGDHNPSDASSATGKSSAIATPTSAISVNQFFFSPISQTRRKSASASSTSIESKSSAKSSNEELPNRSRGLQGRTMSSNILKKVNSVDSFRRNVSTSSVLTNTSYGAEASTPTSRLSRRASGNEISRKSSLNQISVLEDDVFDNSTNTIELNPSNIADNQVNDDFVGPQTTRKSQKDTLTEIPSENNSEELQVRTEQSPDFSARNVRSISFTRVRD